METGPENAIVIGGGIVGWATALSLVERGIRTRLIDADDPHAATQAGAGIITLGTSQNLTEAYIDLATAAIQFYPELTSRLDDLNAGDTGYKQVGAFHVAFSDYEASELPTVVNRLRSRRTPDVIDRADIRIVTGDEARELFPPLSPDIPAAVWYADAARVNGRLMRAALRKAALTIGCTESTGSASIALNQDRIVVTIPDGVSSSPDIVVIAGGAWSAELGDAIGASLAVVPQRGQIAHFDWTDDSTDNWPSIETDSRYYMLAFPGGRVVSGATRELDVGFDPRLTAAGMQAVLGNALRIAPGLAQCTVAEFRVGLRPFSTDGRPYIGAIPGTANGWICTGHGPSGLTVGPYSGHALAQMVTTGTSDLDLRPYAVDRAIEN